MNDLRLYCFGSPRIDYQGSALTFERRKAFALAAYLALADQPQSRDVLSALLWPDLDHDHALSALRSTLYALTAPADVEWIQADRVTLAIKPEAIWVDVRAFLEQTTPNPAHGHSADALCAACADTHRQAVALYTEDFLLGFSLPESPEFEDWQLMQRESLRRELAGALRRLALYEADAGHSEQAIADARQWVALDPLHESAHRLLMRLLAVNGQRTEALRQYDHLVELLDTELATPPEEETTQLHREIQENLISKASGTPSHAASSILPPLPPLIVGREGALQAIKEHLGIGGGERRLVTVIQGWPGVGKSTIAALLAHDSEVAAQFPDGVLWASLGAAPDISGQITAWADALGLSEPTRARRVEEMSAQITAALRDKRVLLIVDDAWSADHAAPFRVGGQNCSLVLTSRLNDVAVALAPAADDIYRLPILTEADSLSLLAKLSPKTVAENPEEARALVADLEGLPLAIHVAGRLLHAEGRLGWGVNELLEELRQGARVLQAQPPSVMIGAERETAPTVAALLKRSSDALDPETRDRFAFLGLFAPKPATFDLAAMAAAWNTDDPRPCARLLVDRGLLEPVSGGRFQMHALLVVHARSLLEAQFGSLI